MSREDFNKLSSHEQEVFINGDGVIEPSPIEPVTPPLGAAFSSGETPSLSPQPSSIPDCVQETGVSLEASNDSQEAALPPNELPDASPEQSAEWKEGFDILDPVELLYLLDDSIKSGETKLHDWQVQFMMDFARKEHTKDSPFNAEVQACNGSGKDKFVVAACIVWLCMRFKDATGVATNGSGVQLDNQTERYIRRLCESANNVFNAKVWKCNYREYQCLVTQSVIILFATDEANKAEGFHPLQTGAKLAIFASEAKAIPDDIFTALTRCTGMTHRIDVSTPGLPNGYFFDRCSMGISRKDLVEIKSVKSVDSILYHITAYDCPHITEAEIEGFASKLAGGKNNSVFKSGILSLFGTTDEMVVIPYTYVNYAVNWQRHNILHIPESHNNAGLDLSDGGAENVLIVRNGNKVIGIEAFRFEDTEDTIDYLETLFKNWNFTSMEATINADCCGLGKPMLNALKRRGWKNIRYIDSRSKAREPKVYYNRGTELFFNVRLLMEHKEIILPFDALLQKQLATRYYKITTKNIHQLLTKQEQRSRGYPSPDRADALNLAFWNYKSTWTPHGESEDKKPFEENEDEKMEVKGDFDMRVWSKGGRGSMPVANGGVSNFSELENAVKEHNARVLAQRN